MGSKKTMLSLSMILTRTKKRENAMRRGDGEKVSVGEAEIKEVRMVLDGEDVQGYVERRRQEGLKRCDWIMITG